MVKSKRNVALGIMKHIGLDSEVVLVQHRVWIVRCVSLREIDRGYMHVCHPDVGVTRLPPRRRS